MNPRPPKLSKQPVLAGPLRTMRPGSTLSLRARRNSIFETTSLSPAELALVLLVTPVPFIAGIHLTASAIFQCR